VSLGRAANIAALQVLSSLQHLALDSTECSAASWALLAKLPSLQTLEMYRLEIGAGAPAAAVKHLESVRLRLLHTEEQLPGCLARQLPQLQHACLDGIDTARLATALQGHQQLRELVTARDYWGTAALALLVSLPQLQMLLVYWFDVDAISERVAPALHTLQFDYLHFEKLDELQLAGCLARQLPQLCKLVAARCQLHLLASALQGHQQLRHLEAEAYRGGLYGPGPDWQHDVLVDLASCSRLQELSVGVETEMVTAAGCAALAAGACRESLTVVELRGAAVEPAHVAVLLAAGMPALQQVVFSPPSAGRSKAAVLQQVEQVLPAPGMWGVAAEAVPYCSTAPWVCKLTRRAPAVAEAVMPPQGAVLVLLARDQALVRCCWLT
jgi:hypothetical protein